MSQHPMITRNLRREFDRAAVESDSDDDHETSSIHPAKRSKPLSAPTVLEENADVTSHLVRLEAELEEIKSELRALRRSNEARDRMERLRLASAARKEHLRVMDEIDHRHRDRMDHLNDMSRMQHDMMMMMMMMVIAMRK
eukprot:TRINITY_DN9395_c0_g3_i1.p1 TRINITY_DN9395_c0_g3~~TRINITY_DN9395_c0_g3_i1.p1  ORF type:complete len:140 (+),score=25.43 TRINITY_DN9395_c0_g3_i1:85-504(+)